MFIDYLILLQEIKIEKFAASMSLPVAKIRNHVIMKALSYDFCRDLYV